MCNGHLIFHLLYVMAISKAIGSLDRWVPDNNCFKKRILTQGFGSLTPNDGAFCTIYLSILG